MRISLAIMQLICMILVFVFELKRKSPMVFCWGVLIIMFGSMHCISAINPHYKYGSGVLNEASAFATLFCAIYIAVRIVAIRGAKRVTTLHMKEDIVRINIGGKADRTFVNLVDVLLLLSVIVYSIIIINESGGVIIFDKRIVYSSMEHHTGWMLISAYIYYSSAPILLYHLYKHQPVRSAYATLLIIIKTALSLSRMDMVFIITAIVGCIILKQEGKELRTLLLLAAMVIVFIYALYALRVFRNLVMSPDYASNCPGFSAKILDLIMRDDGDLGWRKVLYYFIQNDNEFEGLGTGAGYRRLLLLPIPSSLSGGLKPEDICITIGRAWRGVKEEGIVKYTMTPTLFGDCYANLGFAGCFLGGVWAVIATLIDVLCNRRNEVLRVMLFGLSSSMLVDVGRGAVYNSVCGIYYGSILIFTYYFFLTTITRLRTRQNN